MRITCNGLLFVEYYFAFHALATVAEVVVVAARGLEETSGLSSGSRLRILPN